MFSSLRIWLCMSVCLLIAGSSIFAQSDLIPEHRCGDVSNKLINFLKDPTYLQRVDKAFNKAKAVGSQNQLAKDPEVLSIPVVVHNIFFTSEQQLSVELIQSQIDVLNEDFRRMNADTSETREVFADVAGDAGIEFYLAEVDPDGNPTDGITYFQTDVEVFGALGIDEETIEALVEALDACGLTIDDLADPTALDPFALLCIFAELEAAGIDIEEILGGGEPGEGGGMDAMKFEESGGVAAWPTDQYMNIWVCNLGELGAGIGNILGFAYPPAEAPNWPEGQSGTAETDGVVVHYQAFGYANPTLPAGTAGILGLGRTCTHEVGHYLGLRHSFGDGDCSADDGFEDTPPCINDQAVNCSFTANTCVDSGFGDITEDRPDQIENFMDYSDETCQNMFTNQQIEVMRAMLEGPRVGLLSGALLGAPVAGIIAPTEVLVNTEVEFESDSYAAMEWFWNFGDGVTSEAANPLHTFTEVGTYTVILTVTNDEGTDFTSAVVEVVEEVTPGIEEGSLAAGFQLSPNPCTTDGFVSVSIAAENLANTTLSVYDIDGRVIATRDQLNSAQFDLDLSTLANGMYFVNLKNEGASTTKKLLIQR